MAKIHEVMTTKQIRFEKDYPKLQGLERAMLLHVFVVEFRELGGDFKTFDARQAGGTYYQFSFDLDDKVLCLVFGDLDTYKTFITVRRRTPQKESFYRASIGEWFEIVRGG